jgi:phosphoribosyl 1,2-cyclic phosphodiesterase
VDLDKGRLALAIYEIVGYGLNQAFPDAAYVSDAEAPPELSEAKVKDLVTQLSSDQPLSGLSPEIQALLAAALQKLLAWGLGKLGL